MENSPLQNEAMFLKNEANTLFTLGHYEEAIGKYTASINFYMGDKAAWLNRAATYEKLGMLEEAQSDRRNAQALIEGKFTVCKQSGEVTYNNPKVCKDGT